ncbi:hypothetical protein [Chondrinema litorale]|uniref:hypothetical protein n=1 Tax=Chondrinema litorale TaxID=2994555 RepID=UPI002543DFFE|nr:hypothetical protein [Chondrinema litorale]UZR98929.1 hypothetical protein OQ292_34325 [Chondrinema litorale]
MVQPKLYAQILPVGDSTYLDRRPNTFKKERKLLCDYLSAAPSDRINVLKGYIQLLEKNNAIGLGDEAKYMIWDLVTLSNVTFSHAFFTSGGWAGSYFTYRSKDLPHQFELWENALVKRLYLKPSNRTIQTIEVAYYYNQIFVAYVKNRPDKRIEFMEINLYHIDPKYIKLMQLDLDTIFGVETPSVVVKKNKIDKENFKKAKEIWLSKMKG